MPANSSVALVMAGTARKRAFARLRSKLARSGAALEAAGGDLLDHQKMLG
ncbi:MAG: hypothetical protein QOH32_1150, partial [Bradyrhizobium sp.]|nr:hypothetical protein [Bradyrhizobium sp.]